MLPITYSPLANSFVCAFLANAFLCAFIRYLPLSWCAITNKRYGAGQIAPTPLRVEIVSLELLVFFTDDALATPVRPVKSCLNACKSLSAADAWVGNRRHCSIDL